MTEAEVLDYLREHPGFLQDHPELLAILTPPDFQTETGVVDMQRFMVSRLREQIDELQGQFRQMLGFARDNQTALQQVHQACLLLLQADSESALWHVVHQQFPVLFGMDVVRLVCEVDITEAETPDDPERPAMLARPALRDLLAMQPVRLGGQGLLGAEIAHRLFGGAAPMMQSFALVRMALPEEEAQLPSAALLFASRDMRAFDEGQGTDLLHFLGKVTALALQKLEAGPRDKTTHRTTDIG